MFRLPRGMSLDRRAISRSPVPVGPSRFVRRGKRGANVNATAGHSKNASAAIGQIPHVAVSVPGQFPGLRLLLIRRWATTMRSVPQLVDLPPGGLIGPTTRGTGIESRRESRLARDFDRQKGET